MAEAMINGESSRTRASVELRTAAWYGDRTIDLELPRAWDVSVFSPNTGPVLSADEIWERLDSPVDQQPIRERCSPDARPLIIVDDLNRPTQAARILPPLVRQFTDAGVPKPNITIIVGPGTHAPPTPEAIAKKVGSEMIRECRVRGHDCRAPLVKIGRTSFGTPVLVPHEVVQSDFVVGVGGVYPNHTAGFGGGAKAALGILGLPSIAALHFGHRSVGWGIESTDSTFRRDLREIAELIGLQTSVLVVTDGRREIVDLACGAGDSLYQPFLASAKQAFRAPRPDSSVNVVVANTYPGDLSLTFVQMKGLVPLRFAPPNASRVVVGACSEGLGFHGLFPFMNAPPFHRYEMLGRRIAAKRNQPRQLVTKGTMKVARRARSRILGDQAAPRPYPIWLFCPSEEALTMLPPDVPGFRLTSSWPEILEAVAQEQTGRPSLRTFVYAAAPLQWLD